MPNILVTFQPNELQRSTLLNSLDGFARVVFLSDLAAKDRARELSGTDVLISWNLSHELTKSEFGIIQNVRFLQLLSAGVDHVDFCEIPEAVMVAGNPGAYAEQMAEHVLAMILTVFKNLLDRHSKLVRGVFEQDENRLLRGSTCAILGFGGIGKATARLLRCFGVSIFAINTSGRTTEQVEFIGTMRDLEYVLRNADILLVSLPLTKSTTHLLGGRELGWMKENATIINVARGAIIDEKAIFDKLKKYPQFSAGIDAWWAEPNRKQKFETNYPFLKLPNVLGSPHNSGLVPNSFVTAALAAAENVKRFINKEQPYGIVNRSDYT